jgi:hypothetical protein
VEIKKVTKSPKSTRYRFPLIPGPHQISVTVERTVVAAVEMVVEVAMVVGVVVVVAVVVVVVVVANVALNGMTVMAPIIRVGRTESK